MVALGAELIVHGDDFQAAREHARALADERGLRDGRAVRARPRARRGDVRPRAVHAPCRDLDVVYVPVGMGSGICGLIGGARPARPADRDRRRRRRGRAGDAALVRGRPRRRHRGRRTRSSTASPAASPTPVAIGADLRRRRPHRGRARRRHPRGDARPAPLHPLGRRAVGRASRSPARAPSATARRHGASPSSTPAANADAALVVERARG